MKYVYRSIEQMLGMIDEPNGSICYRILADNFVLFGISFGSSGNHQSWPGGYLDHVREVMNLGVVQYEVLDSIRPLPFSLSDLLLVLYLHDIEKPWRYEVVDGRLQRRAGTESADRQAFRMRKISEYGIVLTSEQENGIRYCEGEGADYSSGRRVMGPLACVAHMCDVASARLWYDCPEERGEWVCVPRSADRP